MKQFEKIFSAPVKYSLLLFLVFSGGCNIYKFHDTHVDSSIKTVKINTFGNQASYVNPQLSPRLTDKLRQKIVGQTKLSPTSNDNADWEISGYVNGYSFTTSAISNQQVATNRLTVTVHVTLNDHKNDKTKEYDVSRAFEFNGSQSIQQAESSLGDEMVRSLTDDIFNKLFSDW